jgi:hypothetical protein
MPACTVLLFYPTHFYRCVLPYAYYCSCNSRAQVTPATGIVLRILYTPMLAAIAERPGVQGWGLKVTSVRGDPSFDGESLCTFFFKPCVALCSHCQSIRRWDKCPIIIWQVQWQQLCLITILFHVCNYWLLVKNINEFCESYTS